MSEVNIIKRDGTKEEFKIEKINKVVQWAIEGIKGVNLSDIEINAKINIRDGITSQEVHKVMIESAANLISIETPNYQYVAARLLTYELRKSVWGGKNPPKLIDFVKENVNRGVYDADILNLYSEKDFNKINEFIDHDRDFIFTYAGIKQLVDKYLVQDRKTKQVYETPQFAYILIAAILFAKYPAEERLKYVKKTYNYFSKHKINLPTPIMAGVRESGGKSFASCLLTTVDDTKESIFANVAAIGLATTKRYGIGFNIAHMRAAGAPISNGKVVHTGKIPFLKVFEATVKSCHQNGIRGGSATCTFNIFDYEIEDLLVLKNNAGTEENRVRKLDYSVAISKLFYQRWLNNKDITLFSSHECKDLFEKFGTKEFDELYLKYEADKSLKFKKTISAHVLFEQLVKERIETGRIYIINVDNANDFSPWLDTVQMSNLCQEVIHPTIPIQFLEDPDGEMGICILAAVNMLEIKNDVELEDVCDIIVRALEEVIDYQEYFCPAASNFAKKRRSLGIGVTNLAAWLAKNNVGYESAESPNLVAAYMEKQQFFLLKASMNLAKERGACEKFDRTKYSLGQLPIDNYKKEKVDKIITQPLSQDWEWLRGQIKENGLRHSTMSCCMPAESCLKWNQKVKTNKGYKNFHQILEEGGHQWEEIEENGLFGWITLKEPILIPTKDGEKSVTKVFYNGKGNLYSILLENGQEIKCTGKHKFLVGEGWVSSRNLLSGEELKTEFGTIKIISVSYQQETGATYDIEVPETHNYYIKCGDVDLVSHNSSIIQNSTNGVEPVRSLITYKKSKASTVPVLVPNITEWGSRYTLAFDMETNVGYLNIMAAIQKFLDMSISSNNYYDYKNYPNGLLPHALVMKEILHHFQMGGKTLYYLNSNDSDVDSSCSSGACAI